MYLCLTLIYSQTSRRLIVYSLFIEVVSADQTFEWIINGYLDHAVIKQWILESAELEVCDDLC